MGRKVLPMINRSLVRDFDESTILAAIDLLEIIRIHRQTLQVRSFYYKFYNTS